MSEHPMFASDMVEIVESFVVETQEIFENLDQDLVQLEQTPDDMDLINRIFRAVHTVKGTAGFLSFEQMSTLAHRFEDVLNKMRKGQLKFEPWMLDVMLEAFDLMKVLLQQVIDKKLEDIDMSDILSRLEAIASGAAAQQTNADAASAESAPAEVEPEAAAETPDEPTTDAVAEESTAAPAAESAVAEANTEKETPDVRENESAAQKTESPSSSKKRKQSSTTKIGRVVDSTIRVDVERLDNLMNLVGELVLGRNRLAQIVGNIRLAGGLDAEHQELVDTTTQIDFITAELQNAVMKTRMVQIGRIFNKFPRLIRDLSREFNKEIELITEGEETELDKSVIEEISDPLVHLIRNAVDHGIETPEEREKLGKPRKGHVYLRAGHEGNHIVIEIEDDGRGIDAEKIKAKAVEKGIISAEEAREMSTTEAYNLIFMPGFSTAQKLTSVSGRGVGMDVVKTNITKLNGMIAVQSEVGKGTRFVLKLPLTLAIIQGLLVRVASEVFAVPLSSVIEVVRTTREDVNSIKGEEVIRLRDSVLPLIHVKDVYGVPGETRDDRFYTVVVGIGNRRYGLIVDDMLGQKEIVIKPLGAYLENTPGIAGSTILGDGRVIMILDIGEMLKMVRPHQQYVV